MIAVILNVLIIMGVMWVLFRFMYPKPPQDFFAKAGDDTTLRQCDHCGHTLATYRGILEGDFTDDNDKTHNPNGLDDDLNNANAPQSNIRFFCNEEHRQSYYQNHQKQTTKAP